MFGFILGTVCLIGLIATLRRGRFGYGGGCGHGGGRGHGHGFHRGGYGRGWGGGGFGGGGWGGGGRGWQRGGWEGRGGPDHDFDPGHAHGHGGYGGYGGYGGHEGPDAPDARDAHERVGRGPKHFILRRVFERLDTTPGQEKVIAAAYDEIREAIHQAKQGWKASRGDIGKAVRSESFDAVHLGEVFGKHDDAIDGIRKAFVSGMQKVHDALDERQRSVLADLIESGPFGGGGGGFGYRGGY